MLASAISAYLNSREFGLGVEMWASQRFCSDYGRPNGLLRFHNVVPKVKICAMRCRSRESQLIKDFSNYDKMGRGEIVSAY
ncbi:hypothetical protein GDO78_007806 [Eleutherodactylus coqui]|uniref:Uncharacterized protein n=1 Tax=Eleutherodactylus coqui TaxID=57060 RepID=A0A8J6FI89_ELECQ|nr:hypothetical protein GDO78_007806 [Eleutherodactylus coqui]